jgi:ABC-type glycerol-3-phosphate transport system permease component
MGKKEYRLFSFTTFVHMFFILLSMAFVLPFIVIISVSITNESVLLSSGYSLFPKQIDFTAYQYVFKNPGQIIDSYTVTAIQAILGTILSILVMSLCAYPLSLPHYKFFHIFHDALWGWVDSLIYFNNEVLEFRQYDLGVYASCFGQRI